MAAMLTRSRLFARESVSRGFRVHSVFPNVIPLAPHTFCPFGSVRTRESVGSVVHRSRGALCNASRFRARQGDFLCTPCVPLVFFLRQPVGPLRMLCSGFSASFVPHADSHPLYSSRSDGARPD